MEFTADALAKVNELNENLQYYFVLTGPMKWALIEETIEGRYRNQTVLQELVTEESFQDFLTNKLGNAPKPEKSLFKNLLEK